MCILVVKGRELFFMTFLYIPFNLSLWQADNEGRIDRERKLEEEKKEALCKHMAQAVAPDIDCSTISLRGADRHARN